jgi:basic membrane protein A
VSSAPLFPRSRPPLTPSAAGALAALSCFAYSLDDRGAGAGESLPSTTPAAPVARPSNGAAPPIVGVAFVYSDYLPEAGWTFAHDQARKKIQADFQGTIGVTWVQDVPTDKDADRILRTLAKRRNLLIFETTPGFQSPMLKAAKEHPKVRFEHVAGSKTTTNLRTYDSRTYEGAYLAGVIAGGMTKTNKLGVVASVPTPDVVCEIDSFTLGAQSVNPNVATQVVWVNRRSDPPKEAEGAQALLASGVDVLMQTTDSKAVLQAAEKAGKFAFGWQSDMSKFVPKAHLGSVVIDWTPYYRKAVSEALAGTWKPRQTWWGVKEGAIDLASVSSLVPASLRQTMETAKQGLRDGTFAIWKGPIVDQAGKPVLKPNQVAKDEFLRRINFYVKGVTGSLPKEP